MENVMGFELEIVDKSRARRVKLDKTGECVAINAVKVDHED